MGTQCVGTQRFRAITMNVSHTIKKRTVLLNLVFNFLATEILALIAILSFNKCEYWRIPRFKISPYTVILF